MRIVAGRFKGRRLTSPPGDRTRPMLDRVREAVFSTLGDAVDGARVLDLYAGTGSLGLESLSRGARFARFVERDGAARRVLAANVEAFGVGDEVEVLGGDALHARSHAAPAGAGEGEAWVDLAFADPPYPLWKELHQRRRLLDGLAVLVRERLAEGATLVLHTHPRDLAERELAFAASLDHRDYNNSRIWYLG